MPIARLSAAFAALLVLWACTSEPHTAASPGSATAAPASPAPTPRADVSVDPAHLEPLADLPECEPAPSPAARAAPELVALPSGSVVTSWEETGPLTQVTAYVALAPPQILAFYQQQGLEILHLENEVFDAEVLVSDGQRRVIVNSQAVCRDGSTLLATVVSEQPAP